MRAEYAVKNMLGVLIAHNEVVEGSNNKKLITYFLPLVNCTDPNDHSSCTTALSDTTSASQQQALPFQCGTTLPERRQALLEILRCPHLCKICFNVQLTLIPFTELLVLRETQDNNIGITWKTSSVTLSMQNFFDPRIVTFLCNTDITEGQLELANLFNLFRIKLTQDRDNGFGRFSRAVTLAKHEMAAIFLLHDQLVVRLQQANMLRVFRSIEMPVACLLADMEQYGVAVNIAAMDEIKNRITSLLAIVQRDIFSLVGYDFNVASPEQVARALYGTLKLPAPTQNSKKGKHLSTSEEDLQRITNTHPVVDLILSFRSLSKIKSTYVEGLRNLLC